VPRQLAWLGQDFFVLPQPLHGMLANSLFTYAHLGTNALGRQQRGLIHHKIARVSSLSKNAKSRVEREKNI